MGEGEGRADKVVQSELEKNLDTWLYIKCSASLAFDSKNIHAGFPARKTDFKN